MSSYTYDMVGTIEGDLLSTACKIGDLKALMKLLAENAHPDSPNYYGRTALHTAAEVNNLEAVKILLSNHCDVNAVDSNGVTALHLAAMAQHISVVKLLLSSKANFGIKCTTGCIARDFSPYDSPTWKVLRQAEKGYLPTVDFLTQARDLPTIPQFAFISKSKKKSGKTGKKKGGKKGKKGKKSGGKKKGGKKGKKK